MMIYAAGAALSLGAFGLIGAGGSRRFWAAAAAAAAAFAAAAIVASRIFDGRNLSITFLFWFMAGAGPAALAVKFRRLDPRAFAAFAASDVLLAGALTFYRQDALSWAVPHAGSWKGAWLPAALAALVRLAAPALVSDAADGAALQKLRGARAADGTFLLIGWWQGVFLAGWVGASGRLALAAGGMALWVLCCFSRRSRLSMLCLAGGTAAVAAGLGAGHVSVAVIAAAATAFALGETLIALWAVAALPLSAAGSGVDLDLDGWWVLAAAAPVALAALAFRAGIHAPGDRAGNLVSVPAAAAAPAWTIFQGGDGALWLAYAAAAAALFVFLTTRPEGPSGREEPAFPDASAFKTAALWPAAVLTLTAVYLWLRLAVDGLQSGFL